MSVGTGGAWDRSSAISSVLTAAGAAAVCECGLSCFWNVSNSWKDDMLRLSVNVRVDSRVHEDFLLGNHSWNERQCREWWNSFMQGARHDWFLVCLSCWSHLRDEMCRESIEVNRRSDALLNLQINRGQIVLFSATAGCLWGKVGRGKRETYY